MEKVRQLLALRLQQKETENEGGVAENQTLQTLTSWQTITV